MRIDWMKNANEHNGTDAQKATIQKAAADLEWLAMPKKDESLSLPMMPGEGIKEAIKELKIPKVSHIAIGNDLAPYGFYGIRARYKNADVEIYLIDAGTYMAPLCCFVTEKVKYEAKACPKCGGGLKVYHKDIINPADDVFICGDCEVKTKRYEV